MDVLVALLSRFEAPLLQRHCGEMFHEQLSDVRDQFAFVMAAAARLQEVRVAVASLEAGRSDVARSRGVMELVESTAQLHQDLFESLVFIQSRIPSCADEDRSAEVKSLAIAVSRAPSETVNPVATTKRKRDDDGFDGVKEEVRAAPAIQNRVAVEASRWSGSETESEGAETSRSGANSSTSRSSGAPASGGYDLIETACRSGNSITKSKDRPTVEQLTAYNAAIDAAIESVTPTAGTDMEKAASHRLSRLLKQMPKVFNRGKKLRQLADVTQEAITLLEQATARGVLVPGIRISTEQLMATKLHMEATARQRRCKPMP